MDDNNASDTTNQHFDTLQELIVQVQYNIYKFITLSEIFFVPSFMAEGPFPLNSREIHAGPSQSEVV